MVHYLSHFSKSFNEFNMPKQTQTNDHTENEVHKAPRGGTRTDEDVWQFFRKALAEPSLLEDYHVYRHEEYLELGIWLDADVVFSRHPWGRNLTTKVREILERCGWDGSGSLRLIWLPPTVVAGLAQTDLDVRFYGVWIWHLEHGNGGSWFASQYPLVGNWDPEVPIPPEPEIPF